MSFFLLVQFDGCFRLNNLICSLNTCNNFFLVVHCGQHAACAFHFMSPLSSSSKRASVDKSASPALRDFDIDYYLNPFVPRPRLYLLPRPISWFLGYRKTPRKPVGSLLVHLWSFLGAFVGIAIVEAVFMTRYFEVRGTPVVIASFVCSPSRSSKSKSKSNSKRKKLTSSGRCSNPQLLRHLITARPTPQRHPRPNARLHRRRMHHQALRALGLLCLPAMAGRRAVSRHDIGGHGLDGHGLPTCGRDGAALLDDGRDHGVGLVFHTACVAGLGLVGRDGLCGE